MNKPLINNNNLFTFNEYWTLNLLCKNPIHLTDFYKRKTLRPFYRLKADSLATILYSIAKRDEIGLKNTVDILYKDKTEHTINELFLNMLLSDSKDSIRNFKEKRNMIIEENVKNEKEYPDSLFNLIQFQEIRKRLMVSTSVEFKEYSNKLFYGDYKLVKRNYGLSFLIASPVFDAAILTSYSFDINWIEYINEKYYPFRETKYYFPEYSDTSNVKVTLGFSYSVGILLVNNQKFNASMSGFISEFFYDKKEGFGCAGVSLSSNIYMFKYNQIRNINGSISSKRAWKISIYYDFINKQASAGIGTSFNKIKESHYLKTNFLKL